MTPIQHIVLYKGTKYLFDNYDAAIHFKGQKKTAELFTFASIPIECSKLLDNNRKLNRRNQVLEHRAAKWRRRYAAILQVKDELRAGAAIAEYTAQMLLAQHANNCNKVEQKPWWKFWK